MVQVNGRWECMEWTCHNSHISLIELGKGGWHHLRMQFYNILMRFFAVTNPEQLLVTRASNPLRLSLSTWQYQSLSTRHYPPFSSLYSIVFPAFMFRFNLHLFSVIFLFFHFLAAIGCKSASNVVSFPTFFLSTFHKATVCRLCPSS